MEQNQFRIGGVYRNNEGEVVYLRGGYVDGIAASAKHGFTNAIAVHNLSDGRTAMGRNNQKHWANLIPGELTLVNGKWVGFDFKREDEPAKPTTLGDLVKQAVARRAVATKTPTLDKLENTTEPNRPALTWAKKTDFDPFPGYRVTSDTGPMVDATDHPLQRLQLADPACGSAHLLGQGVKS